jgi:hypothetical protein
MFAFRGNESRGHLKTAHVNAAKDFDPRLKKVLNDDFLLLLRRAYSLRYLDDLAVDFNLVIAAREFLAELDFTACMIQDAFLLKRGEKKLEQSYHYHRWQKDLRLLSNNYVLMEVDKQSFISAEPQLIYEVRKCQFRGVLETLYVTAPSPSDGKFLRPACTPIDDKSMSYRFAFEPLRDGQSVNTFEKKAVNSISDQVPL